VPRHRRATKLSRPSERRAQIFRLGPPQVSEQTVLALAQRFGLQGDLQAGSLQQDARKIAYAERSVELVLHHSSGGLRFHDTARWQVDDGEGDVTFDDAAAVAMAERYIDEFAVAPLAECELLRVTRLNVGVVEGQTGVAEERVIDVGVAFQRVIDGVPVSGPGGKVIVYIDHKGELTGVDRIWREIEDVYQQDVELRSPETAQEEVERYWGGEGSGLITIDDVRFGYFERGWDEAQQYLQPAYFLPLTITATDGDFAGRVLARSEHFVAAATSPPELLIPPPPVLEPSPPRDEQRRADRSDQD
jgi:hypothetical protein